MSWKTPPRREADVLTIAGLGPCRGLGRADPLCGDVSMGNLRAVRASEQPDAFAATAGQVRQARSEVLLTTVEWYAGKGRPG